MSRFVAFWGGYLVPVAVLVFADRRLRRRAP